MKARCLRAKHRVDMGTSHVAAGRRASPGRERVTDGSLEAEDTSLRTGVQRVELTGTIRFSCPRLRILLPDSRFPDQREGFSS